MSVKLEVLIDLFQKAHFRRGAGKSGDGANFIREDAGCCNALHRSMGAAARLSLSFDNWHYLQSRRVSVKLMQIPERRAPVLGPAGVISSAWMTLTAVLRGKGLEVFTYLERNADEACAHAG